MRAGQRLWRNPRKEKEVPLDRVTNADDTEVHIEAHEQKKVDQEEMTR
jgi:hypothetical protein